MKKKLKYFGYLIKFKGNVKKAKKMMDLLDEKELIESSLEIAKKVAKASDSIAATKTEARLAAELQDVISKINNL